MKMKHAIVIAMITIMLGSVLVVPSVVTPTSSTRAVLDSPTPDKQVSLAAEEPLEGMKFNINENPSFETMDILDWPESYTGSASGFADADIAYTTDVYSDTYAGYIASHGVPRGGTTEAYLSRSISTQDAILSGGLTLDFYWNTLNNPDIDVSAYVYLQIFTRNGTGYEQEIRYYLSDNSNTYGNDTTRTFYMWNYPTGSWYHFSRDLSTDYAANPYNAPADPTRRVTEMYWYAVSEADSRNTLEFVLDDVSLTNGTYSGWLPNGGFETGNQYWGYTHETPAYVSQSTDSTDGTYSLNMTTDVAIDAIAYATVERSYSYPAGQYFSEPEMTIIEFDWKFDCAPGITWQYATLEVTSVNTTGTYWTTFILGFGSDNTNGWTNQSTSRAFALDGFNVTDTWHYARLDMYDYISEFGSTVGAITSLKFNIYAPTGGSQVHFQTDDFRIYTYPTGDPGFEQAWYESSNTPFAGWPVWNGDTNVIKRTTDSFSGTYACNLTPYTDSNDNAGVWRQMYYDIGPADFLDLRWRLDEINNVGTSYAYARIALSSGENLFYVFGSASSYTMTNLSSNGFIVVDNYNTTGVWHNLYRNVTLDVEEVFEISDPIIINVVFDVHSDYVSPDDSRVSLVVDDIHFTDGAPPVIEAVNQLPATPMYYDEVHVQIDATDERPGIDHVTVYYMVNTGSWESILATGTSYDAYIPAQSYGSVVHYCVVAVDGIGLSTLDDNGGANYTYTVDDDIDPTLTIDTPIDMAEVESLIQINVTADDAGSGVDYVDFIIDSVSIHSDTSSPYTYDWQTDIVDLGMYTIKVEVHDFAGNTYSDSINVTVVDTMFPVCDEPSDQEFDEGTAGHFIVWDPGDPRANSYEVLVDDVVTFSGLWNSSSEKINVSLDGLVAGVYNYTCVVHDDAGNSFVDSVNVTVNEVVTTTTTTITTTTTTTTTSTTTTTTSSTTPTGGESIDPLLIVAAVGVVGLLLVVFVVLPKMKAK